MSLGTSDCPKVHHQGARWFGIRIVIPPSDNPFHRGIQAIQTTNLPLIEFSIHFEKIFVRLDHLPKGEHRKYPEKKKKQYLKSLGKIKIKKYLKS